MNTRHFRKAGRGFAGWLLRLVAATQPRSVLAAAGVLLWAVQTYGYPGAPATQAQVNQGTQPYLWVTPATLAGWMTNGTAGGAVQNVMIMGAATNAIIYNNSNIYITVFGTNLYNGTYTNVTPLPAVSTAFSLWFQAGGSNYLTMNNPKWNSDNGSTFCLTIGVQTNLDSDGNLIANDNHETGSLTPSNVWTCPLTWQQASAAYVIPVIVTYGAPTTNVLVPNTGNNLTNGGEVYVDGRNGSDLLNGLTPQTPLMNLPMAEFLCTNLGSIIHLGPGFYRNTTPYAAPGVSIIGCSEVSNVCYVDNCQGGGRNSSVENLFTGSLLQFGNGSGTQNAPTNGEIFIIRNVHMEGGEPFYNTSPAGGTVEFINDEIHGIGTINQGYTNILFKDCQFLPGYSPADGGITGVAGLNLFSVAGQKPVTATIQNCLFVAGPNNTGANALNFLIGVNTLSGNVAATNLLGGGNVFNTNAVPGCATITNCAVQRLAAF